MYRRSKSGLQSPPATKRLNRITEVAPQYATSAKLRHKAQLRHNSITGGCNTTAVPDQCSTKPHCNFTVTSPRYEASQHCNITAEPQEGNITSSSTKAPLRRSITLEIFLPSQHSITNPSQNEPTSPNLAELGPASPASSQIIKNKSAAKWSSNLLAQILLASKRRPKVPLEREPENLLARTSTTTNKSSTVEFLEHLFGDRSSEKVHPSPPSDPPTVTVAVQT
jgi:hypothetical protein